MKTSSTTAKLNSGSLIPLLGLGTWKGKEGVCEATYTATKLGYRWGISPQQHIDINGLESLARFRHS